MNVKGLLLDLDGVLVDTEGQYTAFWGMIGREYVPQIKDFAHIIKGHTLDDILSTYFPVQEHQSSIVEGLEAFEASMPFPIYDGVWALLESLRNRGIPAAIVTSSSRRKMQHLYEQHPRLARLIAALVADSDVTHGKPHPEPYLKGAAALGLRPEECAVVEDSASGLAAGRAAGALTIGVATGMPYDVLTTLCDIPCQNITDIDLDKLTTPVAR